MEMGRSLVAILALAALWLAVPEAAAGAATPTDDAGLARPIKLASAAERLFGVAHSTQTQTYGETVESRITTTAVSILGTPAPGIASPFTLPRLAIDRFASNGLTVGATGGYFSS